MSNSALERERRTFDPVPTSAKAARQFVGDLLRRHGASESTTDDCVLVVSELVSNFIEHGNGSGLVVGVDVTDPQWWHIEVASDSSAAPQLVLRPDTWTIARVDEVSGRGLGIIRRLMDDVVTEVSDGQLTIRCRVRRSEQAS